MFRRHWGLILVCVQVMEHGSILLGSWARSKALVRKLRDARSMDSPPFIAFFPKPRSGGCLAAEGLGKKAIFPFADFQKKNESEADGAARFGLGDLNKPFPLWWSGVKVDPEKEGRPFWKNEPSCRSARLVK